MGTFQIVALTGVSLIASFIAMTATHIVIAMNEAIQKIVINNAGFIPSSIRRFWGITFLFITSIILSANAQTSLKERLEQHIYTLASDSLQGRKAGTVYAQKAAQYIVKQWEEIGIEPYLSSSFLQPFNNNFFQNVVGIVRGNDPVLKNEYIVVGAHYDHLGVKNEKIYNGADDNASGVATLIELGRELKRIQSNLKRSVLLVAFDAEEVGLFGSTYFLNSLEAQAENIRLMISIDMVGWYQASNEVKYVGSGTIKGGKDIIENTQLIPEGLHVVSKKYETSIFTATDTQPYAVKGIPTLAVTTGLKSPYHKPQDEAHLIDFEGMALITEHLKNVVEAVSRDIEFESSGKVAKKHRSQSPVEFALSINTGSNHHYYTKGSVDGKSANSFGVGLVSQVNFGLFALRPEVYYDHVRAKYPAGNIATNNLTVPVSLVLQYIRDDFNTSVDVFLGGYYSHRFGGNMGKEKINFENTFNRREGGMTYGIGLFVRPFKIGYTWRRALTNFTKSPNDDNAYIQNRTNYFTISYIF